MAEAITLRERTHALGSLKWEPISAGHLYLLKSQPNEEEIGDYTMHDMSPFALTGYTHAEIIIAPRPADGPIPAEAGNCDSALLIQGCVPDNGDYLGIGQSDGAAITTPSDYGALVLPLYLNLDASLGPPPAIMMEWRFWDANDPKAAMDYVRACTRIYLMLRRG